MQEIKKSNLICLNQYDSFVHSRMDCRVSTRHLFTHCSFVGHEHDEHGTHDEVKGMPIHGNLLQRDPQKVIKEVKKAMEDGEGCQVIEFPTVSFAQSYYVVYFD